MISAKNEIYSSCLSDANGLSISIAIDSAGIGNLWCFQIMEPKLVYKTDQDGCWDADGKSVNCFGSGQDGDLRRGVGWPEPRFDNHSRIVCDRLTGLIWTKDAGLSRFPLTWNEAVEFVRQMNLDGCFGLYSQNECFRSVQL